MANSHTIIKDTPLVTVIKQGIDNGDVGTVLDLTNAKSIYIASNRGITFTIPDVDANGEPLGTGVGARTIDLPLGQEIHSPSGTIAGRIGANMIPPYLQLLNGTGSNGVYYIHIRNRLHGSRVGEDMTVAGARFTSTAADNS